MHAEELLMMVLYTQPFLPSWKGLQIPPVGGLTVFRKVLDRFVLPLKAQICSLGVLDAQVVVVTGSAYYLLLLCQLHPFLHKRVLATLIRALVVFMLNY